MWLGWGSSSVAVNIKPIFKKQMLVTNLSLATSQSNVDETTVVPKVQSQSTNCDHLH